MGKTLVVIGAGPKGVAIAVKSAALDVNRYSCPRIILLDRKRVAANWDGEVGYTDGDQTLGTPPHKDLGFPYEGKDPSVDHFVWTMFSWHAYYTHIGKYASWVDRGRPQPTHADWASYLRWAWNRIEKLWKRDFICLEVGEANELAPNGDRWMVKYTSQNGSSETIAADGVIVTGPGESNLLPGDTVSHPNYFDGKTVWKNLKAFDKLSAPERRIGVIGTGETAASIVVALIETVRWRGEILVISGRASPYSRGESYFENAMYTDPDHFEWTKIDLESRRDFIQRTDRSVFSVHAMDVINSAQNVIPVRARIQRVEAQPDEYGGEELILIPKDGESIGVTFAINATAFDPWWFARLIPGVDGQRLGQQQVRKDILEKVERDLSIPKYYLKPTLHVPMLSPISCGPGFPNLSCLGLLSDRILEGYVEGPLPRSVPHLVTRTT